MNLDAERIQLIDISLEDDFLIDKNLDITPFDLRLSVSLENRNELPFGPKSRINPGIKDRVPFLAKDERDTFRLIKENGDKECNPRKSLAWDKSFFTSPGFLELEELCLVNRGFKSLEVASSHGIEDNVKGKVCHGKNLSHKPSVGAGGRQKTSMKTKVASSNKMVSMQSCNRQQKNTERSEAFSGVVAKSHLVQNTSSRKESQKSNRTIGQTSISTMPAKKPPLRAVSKKGLAINSSVDSSPYKTTPDIKQTASVLKSQEIQGECRVGSYSSGSQKSGIKQSPLSSKTSSLRVPSQKIGFFDMKSETFRREQDGTKHANSGQRRKNHQSFFKKKSHPLESEEKENILHPDNTIIKLELKKDSPSPSQLVGNSSSASSGQCSSSSKKSLNKTHQRIRQTMLSPILAPKTPFLAKFSPLKKSALF